MFSRGGGGGVNWKWSIGSWKRASLSFSAKEIGETREGSGEGEVKGEIWRENNVELLTEARISSVGFFLLEWERICGIGCREKKKNFNTQHNKVKNQIRIKSNPPPKKKSRSPLLLQTYINHMVFFNESLTTTTTLRFFSMI